MWTTHDFRGCGERKWKRKALLKPTGVKKIKMDRLLDLVREYVIAKSKTVRPHFNTCYHFVFKEEIAKHLKVETCYVEQCLHKLNLEGLVTQPVHRAPHDSKRDRNCGCDNSWMGDLYYISKR